MGMKTYTIKKGRHYSNHLPKFCYNKKQLTATIKFSSDCWFPLVQADDYAINKLIGWSYGFHHNNSFRCGWRPAAMEGYVDLFFYVYINSKRIDRFFTTVECNKSFDLTMKISNEGCLTMEIFGVEATMGSRFSIGDTKLGYILFPYFGGNNVASHDIHIDLEIR